MPRKGREAEIIVEQLEKLLTGDLAEITSPDNIYDPVAEIYREVDISVKGKFGSSRILVLIECRDRPSVAKEDVTWIEQLVTKTQDLNASKVIAVATTDFTPAARKKAFANGIELRLLKEFDPLEVKEWVDNFTVENVNLQFEVQNLYIGLVTADVREKINPDKIKPANRTAHKSGSTNEKVFFIEQLGKYISFNDLIMSVSDSIYHDIQPNSFPVEKSFHFLFYDPEFIVLIEIEDEYHRIFKIDVSAKFWKELKTIPVKKVIRYSSDDEIYAERADFCWEVSSGYELTLSIQKDLGEKKQNVLFFVKNNNNN